MTHPVLKNTLAYATALLLFADAASAQQQPNVPANVQVAQDTVESAVARFRIGVVGGVGLDPELVEVGAHAAFGPVFNRGIEVRPGIELGLGEVTTFLGINVDVLYLLPGATTATRWMPYIGVGPTFGLSHRNFDTDDLEHVDTGVVQSTDDDGDRFDFSDTDPEGGMNFIAGARNQRGLFFELKATASRRSRASVAEKVISTSRPRSAGPAMLKLRERVAISGRPRPSVRSSTAIERGWMPAPKSRTSTRAPTPSESASISIRPSSVSS